MVTSFCGVELQLGFENRVEVEKDGSEIKSIISLLHTNDQLSAEVSYQISQDGSRQIRLTEFLADPPPIYDHLNKNGRMPVTVVDDGKTHIALLRALRKGGREWPTLNQVYAEELDGLLGISTRDWLSSMDITLSTWSSLNPAAKRYKDSLAVSVPSEKTLNLVGPWALTRVVALMKRLGERNLDAL